jgi:hypothetical protein
VVVLASLAIGLIYGKAASLYHWYLPPNWLDRLIGADGESSIDAAYVSLYIDAIVVGLGARSAWRFFPRRNRSPQL